MKAMMMMMMRRSVSVARTVAHGRVLYSNGGGGGMFSATAAAARCLDVGKYRPKRCYSSNNNNNRKRDTGFTGGIVEAEYVEKSGDEVEKKRDIVAPPESDNNVADILEATPAEEEEEEETSNAVVVPATATATDAERDPVEEEDVALPKNELKDFCFKGTTTTHDIYGRIIDAARMTADLAYEANGAVVGALAEAGGIEGAAEQWLQGFLALVLGEDDHAIELQLDIDELFKLALSRNGNHYIKRCVDMKQLKIDLGSDDYYELHVLATDLLVSLNENHPLGDIGLEEEEEDHAIFVDPSSLAKAKEIWGDDILKELSKKSAQQVADDQWANQHPDLVQKVEMEQGEWWGAATNKHPKEAYQRLLDSVRYGTMLAYEQQMSFIGVMADIMQEQNKRTEDQEDEEETYYDVDELGPHAKDHLHGFLEDLQREKLMPDWWNKEHEDALFELAANKQGGNFLGYPMDTEELKDAYRHTGVRQKIMLLADAAKEVKTHS